MSAMDTEDNFTYDLGVPGLILGIRRAETELRQLFASATDRESEHGERDRILLELLDVLAPEVATLVREREDKVGYWYA